MPSARQRPLRHDARRRAARVDVYLPEGADRPAAHSGRSSILTPYYRRFKVDRPGRRASPNVAIYRDFFVPRGYALVVVDVRGCGASFGTRDCFRSPRERDDHREIADWIVAQPWSSGAIGSTGISYLGAAACFLASTGHPAVKAIAPLFAVHDTYSDHVFPGGIKCTTVTENYDDLVRALDLDLRDKLAPYPYFNDPRYAGPAAGGRRRRRQPARAPPSRSTATASACATWRPSSRSARKRRSHDPRAAQRRLQPLLVPRPDAGQGRTSTRSPAGTTAAPSPTAPSRGSSATRARTTGCCSARGTTARAPTARPGATARRSRSSRCWPRCCASSTSTWPAWTPACADEAPVHFHTVREEKWQAAEQLAAARREHTRCTWRTTDGSRSRRRAPPQCAPYKVELHHRHRAEQPLRAARRAGGARLLQGLARPRGRACSRSRARRSSADTELSGHAIVQLHVSTSEHDASVFVYLSEVDADGRSCATSPKALLRLLHRAEARPPAELPADWPYRTLPPRGRRGTCSPACAETVRFALLPVSWTLASRQPPAVGHRGHRRRPLRAGAARPPAAAGVHPRRRGRLVHRPACALTGSHTMKRLPPPSRGSQRTLPPWASAICRTSARPNPTPPACSEYPSTR